MNARKLQYAVALAIGTSTFLVQLATIYTNFNLGLANPKAEVMQLQLIGELATQPTIVAAVIAYATIAWLAHALLMVSATGIYRTITATFSPHNRDSTTRSTCFMLFTLLIAAMWNKILSPTSRAFENADLLVIQPASPLLIWAGTGLIAAAAIVSLAIYCGKHPRLATTSLVTITAIATLTGATAPELTRTQDTPDIIIIGIDSLRPDLLVRYGFPTPSVMPRINSQLDEMAVFTDTTTPLARTFVSYMSVLTGRYPTSHGARFNLHPRSELDPRITITSMLEDFKYYRILAIDETRFANFDESFGFDKIAAPRVGAVDFLIGGTYDLLATNLLLKVPYVNRGFLHLHGNRAAHRTYGPLDHPQRVVRAIRNAPGDQPLFLVSHLCLPHWPYSPAGLLEADDRFEDLAAGISGYEDAPAPYLRSLASTDKQLGIILDELRAAGRLENAILVIISDHGEDFAMSRDKLQDDSAGGIRRGFYGHGGFALSAAQYRVLLSMQRFVNGRPTWRPRLIKGSTSLVDVTPTLVDEVSGLDPSHSFDGVSLRPQLTSGEGDAPHRVRFIESGVISTGIETNSFNELDVAAELSFLYRITDDLRFEIKSDLLPAILARKQRGAIEGSLGVATRRLQDHSPSGTRCWAVADYNDRTLKCVSFPAQDEKVAKLQNAVCNHFREDRDFVSEWCAN